MKTCKASQFPVMFSVELLNMDRSSSAGLVSGFIWTTKSSGYFCVTTQRVTWVVFEVTLNHPTRQNEDEVSRYNPRLCLFPGWLRSRWHMDRWGKCPALSSDQGEKETVAMCRAPGLMSQQNKGGELICGGALSDPGDPSCLTVAAPQHRAADTKHQVHWASAVWGVRKRNVYEEWQRRRGPRQVAVWALPAVWWQQQKQAGCMTQRQRSAQGSFMWTTCPITAEFEATPPTRIPTNSCRTWMMY